MPYGPSDPQLEIGYLDQPDITVSEILKKSQTRSVLFEISLDSKFVMKCTVLEDLTKRLLLMF